MDRIAAHSWIVGQQAEMSAQFELGLCSTEEGLKGPFLIWKRFKRNTSIGRLA